MLTLNGVTKVYGGWWGKPALHRVNLQLCPGQIVALLGENGAGKTTLMKLAAGLVQPSEGEVLLDGVPVTWRKKDRLAYASSEHTFFGDLSAEGHAELYAQLFPRFRKKRFRMLMKYFDLPVHRAAGGLSTGMKNQLEMALALCKGAQYILMDEPFAGSDIFNRQDFYKLLAGLLEENEHLLLSTHLVDEVRPILSRAVVLREGELLADADADELDALDGSLSGWLRELYGHPAGRAAQFLQREGGEPG